MRIMINEKKARKRNLLTVMTRRLNFAQQMANIWLKNPQMDGKMPKLGKWLQIENVFTF